jgi:hypothetical protein
MQPYTVRIGDVVNAFLVTLPPALEQAVRRHLREIARTATETLPRDSRWARRLGMDPTTLSFELEGLRFSYELNQTHRTVTLCQVSPCRANRVRLDGGDAPTPLVLTDTGPALLH